MALMAQWGAIVTEKPVESMPYNATGNALTNLYILLTRIIFCKITKKSAHRCAKSSQRYILQSN